MVAPGGQPKAKGAAEEQAAGAIPSSAGMTYAGLKSMIYAGLSPDDVRVKGALGYISEHDTLEENPGQGQRGRDDRFMEGDPDIVTS